MEPLLWGSEGQEALHFVLFALLAKTKADEKKETQLVNGSGGKKSLCF